MLIARDRLGYTRTCGRKDVRTVTRHYIVDSESMVHIGVIGVTAFMYVTRKARIFFHIGLRCHTH